MMRQTMLTVTMMVEIAVSTSPPITALIVLVIIKKTVLLDSLPLLLEMAPVMTGPTMMTVTTMAETVVSPIKCNEIIIMLQFLFLGKYYFLRIK